VKAQKTQNQSGNSDLEESDDESMTEKDGDETDFDNSEEEEEIDA